jgi:hypothetical protein
MMSQVPFYQLKQILTYKAPLRGKRVETVSPQYTSQMDCRNNSKEGCTRKGCRFYTADGMVFDADETSQNRLMRGIVCSIALGLAPDETTEWTLADNSSAMVTAQQMARALLAAGQYQTSVWRMPYEA